MQTKFGPDDWERDPRLRVFIDGQQVPHALECDIAEGWVRKLQLRDGRLFTVRIKGEWRFAEEILYGNVHVLPFTPA